MAVRRPPLNRGHSMPTYPSQVTSYTPIESSVPSLASLSLSDSRNSPAGELMRRGVSASEGNTPAAAEAYPFYSSQSHSTTSGSYSQPHPPSILRPRPHSSQPGPSTSTHLPAITSPPSNVSSVLLRSRSLPPQSSVNLKIDSTPHEYTLLAPLGAGFSSDSITIAARKGNVIVVVADRWDQEQDCHYEWQVQFDRDADMSSIHARFENGLLKVTVRRITNYIVRR